MRDNRRQRRIARHVRLAMDHERGLAADLRKIFARAGRAAAAHVAAGQGHLAVDVVGGFERDIAQRMRARLQTAADASAAIVIEELTGQKADAGALEVKFVSLFAVAQQAVRDWLAFHGAAMVRRVTQAIRRTIRGALQRGSELNEPPRVLAKRIRDDTSGEIGRARGEVIARTETHTATQVGAAAAADAAGVVIDKEWGATEDHRTRPAHSEADGQTVEKDADFIVGGERLAYPGDPRGSPKNIINCRCVALYKPRLPK